MTKRVRFEEPQSAMAVDSEAAPVAVAQELRPGYTLHSLDHVSHSEAANAAGLADLLKLIDASQLAAVASGASSAAEALELGTDRTARSKPRSKAPWRRGL
jgi:2-methylcitrate dehydratase PrpD